MKCCRWWGDLLKIFLLKTASSGSQSSAGVKLDVARLLRGCGEHSLGIFRELIEQVMTAHQLAMRCCVTVALCVPLALCLCLSLTPCFSLCLWTQLTVTHRLVSPLCFFSPPFSSLSLFSCILSLLSSVFSLLTSLFSLILSVHFSLSLFLSG